MTDEKPVIEAELMSIITTTRLPHMDEGLHTVGVFSLLHDKKKVGELQIIVGNAFKLGDAFRASFKLYPTSSQDYNEFMGFKIKPDLDQVKPV